MLSTDISLTPMLQIIPLLPEANHAN